MVHAGSESVVTGNPTRSSCSKLRQLPWCRYKVEKRRRFKKSIWAVDIRPAQKSWSTGCFTFKLTDAGKILNLQKKCIWFTFRRIFQSKFDWWRILFVCSKITMPIQLHGVWCRWFTNSFDILCNLILNFRKSMTSLPKNFDELGSTQSKFSFMWQIR